MMVREAKASTAESDQLSLLVPPGCGAAGADAEAPDRVPHQVSSR